MPDSQDSATGRIHVLVSGRVQGVAFRAYAQEEAEGLGLAGWVRNLRGGQVELVAEGPPAAVAALLRWCHRGPPAAQVTLVEARDEVPRGEPAGFRIRPTTNDYLGPDD